MQTYCQTSIPESTEISRTGKGNVIGVLLGLRYRKTLYPDRNRQVAQRPAQLVNMTDTIKACHHLND